MISGDLWITILKLASVPFLMLLNGFFVAAEFAIVKIRDTQLETLVSKGYRRAKVARRIVYNLDAVLTHFTSCWRERWPFFITSSWVWAWCWRLSALRCCSRTRHGESTRSQRCSWSQQ